ncbi:MAG: response regulator [Planctomycetota bacterium]|nr:response regulator [Planctomycetota bacterium]MCB9825386.1 response regulator [Planctomycetota bacterium]MCB9900868.1 response regulator [Planctomycetota bacterium]
MGRILIVEDEETLRDVLARHLTTQGHTCEQAGNGEEGVRKILADKDGYDLIISDIHMPKMDGLAFLRRVRPYVESVTPFMILTAYDEWKYAMEAIRLGACNFLQKNPFDLVEIADAVNRALELRQVYKLRINYKAQLEQRLAEKEDELRRTYDGTVIGFASMIEGKDASTMGHLWRVRDICTLLAREMGFSERELRDVQLGAMLHDVGKYRVPDAILTKPGPLDEDEWKVMRMHPEFGADFVARIPFLAAASTVIRHHHERWDGGGYPDGLEGEDIPLAARIFACVDAYDAIISERCYKGAQPSSVAIAELRRCAGTQFDPGVVEAFERCLPRIEALTKDAAERYKAEIEAIGLGQLPDRAGVQKMVKARVGTG